MQLIDFGLSAFADTSLQESQRVVFQAFRSGDVEPAVRAILSLMFVPPDANIASFRTEFVASLRDWLLLQQQPGLPAERRSATLLMFSNFDTTRRHGLIFRTEMALYYRSLMILDRVLVALDPQVDYMEEVSAFFAKEPWADFDRELLRVIDGLGLTARWKAVADLAQTLVPTRVAAESFFSLTLYRSSKVASGLARATAVCGALWVTMILGRNLLDWPAVPLGPGTGPGFIRDALRAAIASVTLWFACRYLARWLWVKAYDPYHWRPRATGPTVS